MTSTITDLSLDELGRVILSDEALEEIELNPLQVSSGGRNDACSGTTNPTTCSNGYCAGTTNSGCMNDICAATTNRNCINPKPGF
jgi:Tfp pilus assembly protein PilX